MSLSLIFYSLVMERSVRKKRNKNSPFGKLSAAKIQEIIGNAILETTKRHTMLLLRLL